MFNDPSVAGGLSQREISITGTDKWAKWYNHIHMEIDTDTKYPFHTVGFKETASRLLIASGATDKTLLNPLDVLVVGNEQTAILHPLATLVSSNDVQNIMKRNLKKSFRKEALLCLTRS